MLNQQMLFAEHLLFFFLENDMKQTLIAWMFIAACSAASAADPAAIKRGETLYMQHQCYSCHGTQGQGGERNAGPKIFPNPTPFVAFELQMRTPRNVMPRYSVQNINALQLKDLYAFVENMRTSPPVAQIPLLQNAMR
jgi:mono/diheme cytochrome c family protein